MPIFRNDFQTLCRIRIREARHLLRSGEYSGSFHLTGLAIECALKACIAKAIKRHEFPDKHLAGKAFDHNLENLLTLANLNVKSESQGVQTNWAVIKDWKVESRYEVIGSQKAEAMYKAAVARKYGVLKWIRQHW